MKFNWMAPLAMLAISFGAPSAMAQQQDAGRMAAEVCASCHGPNGISISSAFPRLAGQRAEYIEAQLKAFRDKTRGDPMAQAFMWGMSSQLDDNMIGKLAAYYSGQTPPRGTASDAKLVQAGKAIFDQGIPKENVQPCGTCHGANAEGTAAFPRLAGQHAEYLVKQMVFFKSEMRTDTSAVLMHAVGKGMTLNQMEAVAAYLMSK